MTITKETEQHILNSSFDEQFGVLLVEPVKRNGDNTAIESFNPATEEKQDALLANYATKFVTVSGNTYIGKAPIGSATSSAVWRIKKISSDSIAWADGNDSFDNVWDDYLTLTYS